ncbi:MAG: acyl-CoA reductase [Bacteroidales bacterium]|nr:acyl-CoA reductase [Bacteroidales bacterium]
MTFEERIEGLAKLGITLKAFIDKYKHNKDLSDGIFYSLKQAVENEKIHNPFFTEDNVLFAFKYWADNLTENNLSKWILPYASDIKKNNIKKVAIIAAGNIPLVSFHDIISVFLTGHKAIVKLSSKDSRLPKLLWEIMEIKHPGVSEYIDFVTDKTLQNFDAVIATGSNYSQRYFEYYFGRYPHVFRQHRNGIAVIDGSETAEDLEQLTNDIFIYFGLGCRSVSKIYCPNNYDFSLFIHVLKKWEHLFYHHHYLNNYDYQKSIYLLNKESFIDAGFAILKESNQISSPLGVIFYEYYSDICILAPKIEHMSNQIQCVVSKENKHFNSIKFGMTQYPELWEYADNIDIVKFLIQI